MESVGPEMIQIDDTSDEDVMIVDPIPAAKLAKNTIGQGDAGTDQTMNDTGRGLVPSDSLQNVSPPEDVTTYTRAIQHRLSLITPSSRISQAQSYSIEQCCTIAQTSNHINALALPPCSSHLYTGGSDGLIRRYNLSATLNGTLHPDYDNIETLTVKPVGVVDRTESKLPILVDYWENEEEGEWCDKLKTEVKWGRRNEMYPGGKLSCVYSLAVQSQELWGVSGTAVRVASFM